tara:strand:- start:14476 stop:14682 length:207 start_codon:yes stop_codon:yes gene_type:complete
MVALRGDHLLKSNQMKKKKSIGLGDTIHKVTKALGIKKVVDKVSKATGKDCGCNKRQETLNRFFPYNK